MSRHEDSENPNFARVASAGEYWRDRCLIGDGSLFTDKRLWSRENLESDFERRFVDFIVPSDDPKYKTGSAQQWEIFLAEINSPPETYQLMAEFLWVCHRTNSHMKPATKRDRIQSMWEKSGEPLPDHEQLQDQNLRGIAIPGQGVATRFWFELVIFALFVREIKLLDDERARILLGNDGKELSRMWDAWPQKWYGQWPQQWERYLAGTGRKLKLESSPIRHVILYLLFPDYFECIYSGNDKLRIVKAFSEKDMSNQPWAEIDQAVYAIREKLEEQYGSVHFYADPIKSQWRNGKPIDPPPSLPPLVESTAMLNQIFFGPPGTGKTYHTVNTAVKIINPDFLSEGKSRADIKEEFDRLVKNGQIEFVTFHQSFGYEEFVEGIRPTMDGSEGDVTYEIKDGVIKRMCEKAASVKPLLPFEQAVEKLREESSEDNQIKMKTPKLGRERWIWHREGTNSFMVKPVEGSTSWSVSDDKLRKAYLGTEKPDTTTGTILNYLQREYGLGANQKHQHKQNYVLIIDEINRGNVSRIFGELITLIEASKRMGEDEATTVTLPYSNKEFGIPNNLYIIGTMNTADRSIALLDTALRRRFRFVEMMPKPELLRDKKVGDIDVERLLAAMNRRIEALYDRDHQIGHSFFMDLKQGSDINALKDIFLHEVLPLLQEYFYEDWEKINLILNDNGFVHTKKYPTMPSSDFVDTERKLWAINADALDDAANYLKIYRGAAGSSDDESNNDS